jgi:two-component system cell cycle response regulator
MVPSQPPTEVSQASEVDLTAGIVLIVDDNPQNLELIQAYMESLPCRIVVAQDGAEAMMRIESDRPDLVLLDVMMPRVSGFDVCKRIKQNPSTRETVVIMVTALHELGDMERAVESGCDDFVSKPVNKVELLARVRGLLALRLLKRRMNSLLGKGPGVTGVSG